MLPMLFFDVDDTLLDSKTFTFPNSTILALKKLKAAGYKMGIATGRGKDNFLKTKAKDLISWDIIIVNNGQTIYDGNMNVLFEASFTKESVQQCIDIANELGIVVLLKTNPRFITGEANEYVIEVHQHFNNVLPMVKHYEGEIPDAMILYAKSGYDYAPFKAIEGLNVIPCALSYAEVSIAGISKYTSILRALNMLGIKDYIAFGDSPNDIEMLEHATLSIALGNAHSSVKEKASYVTTSIEDDGIYNACINLNLFKEVNKND